MRFQIRKVNPNNERGWPECVVVERVLDKGEAYLIATFRNVDLAAVCLNTLAESLEAATGAVIERELQ